MLKRHHSVGPSTSNDVIAGKLPNPPPPATCPHPSTSSAGSPGPTLHLQLRQPHNLDDVFARLIVCVQIVWRRNGKQLLSIVFRNRTLGMAIVE
ncbi:unnamed protein product [Cuscuta campestris]|uniref:Uncharacterized protein n=1 Tax=Cuscuta campestris TaxID=132261 RepID=A0A484NJP2_9ASTE|nr:unnamed protein product [Cuscuta campestris]